MRNDLRTKKAVATAYREEMFEEIFFDQFSTLTQGGFGDCLKMASAEKVAEFDSRKFAQQAENQRNSSAKIQRTAPSKILFGALQILLALRQREESELP